MNKGDYNRLDDKLTKQDEKLDKQTRILVDIQLNIGKEMSLIKLAHQKLKYTTLAIGAGLLMMITIEYPKLMKLLRSII